MSLVNFLLLSKACQFSYQRTKIIYHLQNKRLRHLLFPVNVVWVMLSDLTLKLCMQLMQHIFKHLRLPVEVIGQLLCRLDLITVEIVDGALYLVRSFVALSK